MNGVRQKKYMRKKKNMEEINQFRTERFRVSWGFLQDLIAHGLVAMGKGKIRDDEEIMNIKVSLFGGYLPTDKLLDLDVDLLIKEEVKIIKFG